MEFLIFKKLVNSISIGKTLPDAVYIHRTSIETIPNELQALLKEISKTYKIPKAKWTIIKLNKRDYKLSFLYYPEFDTQSYPSLNKSHAIDLERDKLRVVDYSKSENPPILHRKETFVLPTYPLYETFIEITQEGEAIGLYENTKSIGFKQNWHRLIAKKGHYLDELGRLKSKLEIPKESDNSLDIAVERHKTAISRHQLSAPMQILAKHNYLNGDYALLDYGCGKGDDLRELELHGLDAEGWDPVHKPDSALSEKDIVNLGFVLNVIEDRSERDATLKKAYSYAKKFLIVSVMLAGKSVFEKFTPYKDGVITSRNTFQKYYSQSEFSLYLEDTLDTNAIAAGQGIFIVFKDKKEEQRFLLDRQSVKRNWVRLSEDRARAPKTVDIESLYAKNKVVFDDFWEATLNLGRMPANSEFEYSEEIRRVTGSHSKALEILEEIHDPELLFEAEFMRKDDLLVYFALGLFGERKPYTQLTDGLKRDVKMFFETHSNAIKQATKNLYSVGKTEIIEDRAIEAYEEIPKGIFSEGHSWTIHSSLLNYLPVELRIYVGCGSQLFGSIDEYDLIKIYLKSGEVDLLKFDDWQKDNPLLIEEIKIYLRNQDVKYTYYDPEHNPQPFYEKHLFK